MIYQIAEKFKSIQGEGVYAGTPMAFIRFVGCSVGKKICHYCDTDFDKPLGWAGGGEYDDLQLEAWVGDHKHVCITGGEPFDQDLSDLLHRLSYKVVHVETSGTKRPQLGVDWLCVSPKPGFLLDVVALADEIKVIVPGLGNGEGWPTIENAIRWADEGRVVFLQPRNGKHDIDQANLRLCEELVQQHPNLRLSVQLHKILKAR